MPKLILKKKAEVLKELVLKGSQIKYSIGANDDNDLVLEDRRVSMIHARIERHANRFYLEDMKSAFGTYVNGKRIEKKVELQTGDEITIGEHTIQFDNPLEYLDAPRQEAQSGEPRGREKSQHSTADAFHKTHSKSEQEVTVEVLDQDAPATTESAPAQPSFAREEMAPYYLLAIYGPYTGKRYQLRYGETKIGRDNKLNDIVIRQNKRGEVDPSISRRHATVFYRDNAFYVSDKRSKTRTFVNQAIVPENEDVELNPGDEIEIVSDQCSTIFRFIPEGNRDTSPAAKAGVWHVRHRRKFLTVGTILSLFTGVLLLVNGYNRHSVLEQRPDPLSLELAKLHPLNPQGNEAARARSPRKLDGVKSLPVLADFNDDGYVDIAAMDFDHNLTLIDGRKKKPVWHTTASAVAPAYGIVAAELNNNDLLDLVYLSENGRMVAVDGKLGAEIWASPYMQSPFSGPPVVADFNGDEIADIAIAEQAGVIHIGTGNLYEMAWHSADLGLEIRSPLSAADLNHDGKAEIICGTERGLVLIIDGSTQKLAGSVDINNELNKARGSIYEENQIRYPIGVADLNADGSPDLIASSIQGNIIAIDGATKNRLWDDKLAEALALTVDFAFPFALGDLTGDGAVDIVVATADGGLRAYLGTGESQRASQLWAYAPLEKDSGIRQLAVADLSKDRRDDIVYVDRLNVLRVVDGRRGTLLWSMNQPIAEPTSMPLIADFGRDGRADIVLLSESGSLYSYQSNSRVPYSSVLWGQRFGQARNTMHADFSLPSPTATAYAMAFGALLLLAASLSTFIVKFRRKRLFQ